MRDLNYVKDTVAGFLAIADSDECLGLVTNVGHGKGITIGDLAKRILELCDRADMPIVTDDQRIRPGKSEVLELVCANAKAKERCGWDAAVVAGGRIEGDDRVRAGPPGGVPAQGVRAVRAVILAGGKGTRLAPYTVAFPKPLMPLGDTPILEIVVRQLSHYGFTHLTMAVGHLSELIQAFFGDGSKWGLKIDYSREDQPLGTAGPLKLIPDLDDQFLVMNGDLLTDLDYGEFMRRHRQQGNDATIGRVPEAGEDRPRRAGARRGGAHRGLSRESPRWVTRCPWASTLSGGRSWR